MILELGEAKEFLGIVGTHWDLSLTTLIEAIPSYLETTTGRTWLDTPIHPLAKTTAKFILQVWFDGPNTDTADRLKRNIDGLCGTLTALGRNM